MHTLNPFLPAQPSFNPSANDVDANSLSETVILGFGCDEGVRRNNGRPGAAGGPVAFAAHWKAHADVLDGGLYTMQSRSLSMFQETFGRAVAQVLNSGRRVLAIGGGHEITWAMHRGMLLANQNKNQSVIGHLNFDAHFDLRPYFNGANSGTSFRQIADERQFNALPFHYLCLGLDYGSTPDFLMQTANDLHAEFHLNTEVQQWDTATWIERIETFASSLNRLYVTVDLDVFRADEAPGVSAVAKNGLNPEVLMPVFSYISSMPVAVCMDIAELNPLYDVKGITAELAVESACHLLGKRM